MACALILGACAGDDPAAAYMLDSDALARGRSLFIGSCTGYCHVEGRSNGDIPNLFDATWVHGGESREIFETISNGVPGTEMVGWGGVMPEGDEDLWRIVAFLKSSALK